VHYLKKHVVGKTISAVKTQEDEIIYGKVGTSASAFQKAMPGKTILDAKQQGKYFWLEMSSPPHPLMHFGMSGWMKFSNDSTAYYRSTGKPEDSTWPPKFWKFILQMEKGGDEAEEGCEVAFVDARRLGRIRLVDAPAEDMRKTSPLKENGPDPVIDKEILTEEWLRKKLRSKKVPVKALLLDQANISGVGNWVGDEVLYQARLHPEQYSNTFSDAQIKQLHHALMYVCDTAVDLLGDSDKLPQDWLMHYRWGKGKGKGKGQTAQMPNGDKITFLTVGGRTSAVVPSVQKKTGAVAGDVAETANGVADADDNVKPKKAAKGKAKAAKVESDADDDVKPKMAVKRKAKAAKVESDDDEEEENEEVKEKVDLVVRPKRGRNKAVKGEEEDDDAEDPPAPAAKKQKLTTKATAGKAKKTKVEPVKQEALDGRRRSGRLSKT
jgi:DNA-formamidopyrimidine glycosylase